jgi:hypothetical protein
MSILTVLPVTGVGVVVGFELLGVEASSPPQALKQAPPQTIATPKPKDFKNS